MIFKMWQTNLSFRYNAIEQSNLGVLYDMDE